MCVDVDPGEAKSSLTVDLLSICARVCVCLGRRPVGGFVCSSRRFICVVLLDVGWVIKHMSPLMVFSSPSNRGWGLLYLGVFKDSKYFPRLGPISSTRVSTSAG